MQVRQIPMAQLRELLDEQLAHGEALLPVTGNSMWPLLVGGRDMVRLARPDRCAQSGDIALYQKADGSYILHRVIRLCAPETCICCGDAQWEGEQVDEAQIIAYVTAFASRDDGRRPPDPGPIGFMNTSGSIPFPPVAPC